MGEVGGTQEAVRWRRGRWLLAATLAVAWPCGALAQNAECDRLYAAIQAVDNTTLGEGRWDKAAQQQKREIDRTQRYADQLGCGQGIGGLFGGDPPQCGAIQDHIQRMQDNLARVEERSLQPDVDPGRRAALLERYNQQCVGLGSSPADLASRSSGDPDMMDPDSLSNVPLNGAIMDGSDQGHRSLGQAICVRTCDGGYFPLGPRASEEQLGALEQLCQASCPNTEARLYTMRGEDLAGATAAADGTSYNALAKAFQFEKTFTPTCTCKPPGQSWVQALAGAEQLLGNGDQHDVTVTASLSDQMARPVAPAATPRPVKPTKGRRATPVQPAATLPDPAMLREAQKGLQAPTASNETSGIGGPAATERTVKVGEGPLETIAGKDGLRRRIRVIVP